MSKTRTITPNPPADFVPSKNDVSYLRPFRVWCQKVLPLVYDDSLSYYELLCKVVDYLNKTMEEVNQLGVDVSNLFNAFQQLQDYVNHYFDNLDVQEEINNKLDDMLESGELDVIIARVTDHLIDWITPELYGCVGDGVTDDTVKLQEAINAAISEGVQLRGSCGKTYKVTANLSVNGVINWNGNMSKILLEDSTINFKTTERIDYSCVENLIVDANYNSQDVFVFENYSRGKINNIIIDNLAGNGMVFNGKCFETVVSYVRLRSSNANAKNVGFIVNATDMYFEYLFGKDIHKFIVNEASGNVFTNCHAWIYEQNTLFNSLFLTGNVSCEVRDSIIDTYETGFEFPDYGAFIITGCRCYINPDYYSPQLSQVNPTFIRLTTTQSDGSVDLGLNARVSNCWIYFPESYEGFFTNYPNFTRIKLSNNYMVNIKDSLYNNTYYNNTSMLGDAELFRLQVNNTMGYLNAFLKQSSVGNNKIGTLPVGMRPSYDIYTNCLAYNPTTNEYASCYIYIGANGDVYLNTTGITITFTRVIVDCTFFI